MCIQHNNNILYLTEDTHFRFCGQGGMYVNGRIALLLLGLLLIGPQSISADDWYRWVDPEGRLILSRKPPPNGAREAPREAPSQSTSPSTASRKSGRPRTPQVDLYVTSWCPVCGKARAYLRQQGIPFNEYDVERDADAARRRKKIEPRGGVPLAVINGRTILGFSPELYQQALGSSP